MKQKTKARADIAASLRILADAYEAGTVVAVSITHQGGECRIVSVFDATVDPTTLGLPCVESTERGYLDDEGNAIRFDDEDTEP